MEPIDSNNPSISLEQPLVAPTNQQKGPIYGQEAEMRRMYNAYNPNPGGKYDLNRIRRKRAEYEFRQLEIAMQRQQKNYCDENSLTALEFQNLLGEKPELMETIYERAFDSLPRQCKTILGFNIKK
jgi:hypothetical protein